MTKIIGQIKAICCLSGGNKCSNIIAACYNFGLLKKIGKRKGIISFSYAPLSLISNIALVAMALSLIAIVVYPILAVFYPAPPGFLTLLVIMLFLGSVQFFVLAILGEYLGRIFEEVKQRPKYIIREIINNHRKTA